MKKHKFKERFLAKFKFVLLYVSVGFGSEIFSLEAKEYNKKFTKYPPEKTTFFIAFVVKS